MRSHLNEDEHYHHIFAFPKHERNRYDLYQQNRNVGCTLGRGDEREREDMNMTRVVRSIYRLS